MKIELGRYIIHLVKMLLYIGNQMRIVINLVIIFLNFLLIQLKDITIIQKISIIGVYSVIYNAVTIFVLLFLGFTHHGTP